MKVSLPTHGRIKDNYPAYLAEFLYRYGCSSEDTFVHFIRDVAKAYPLTSDT